jgi:aryl-alcohol dehydrogenase-like predicted oxidoreductase
MEIESEEINLLKTARELGVSIVAYSPLGEKGRFPKAFASSW